MVCARRSAIALLAYLAVSRRSHSRETVAALLGGEMAEERARILLRNALTDLKNQIGDYLVATRQSIGLNPELPIVLDVSRLEEALRAAHVSGDIAQLQAAVDSYQHEFLEGFTLHNAPAFDEWLLLERERIGSLLVQALDLLCAAYVERGEYTTGLNCARRLLALIREKGRQSRIEQELPNIQAAWDWVLRSVRDEAEVDAGEGVDGEQRLRELALGGGTAESRADCIRGDGESIPRGPCLLRPCRRRPSGGPSRGRCRSRGRAPARRGSAGGV